MKIEYNRVVAWVTMLLTIVTMSFIVESCQDSEDGTNVVTDDQHGQAGLVSKTITPISASFEFNYYSNKLVYISSNRETISQVINKIKKEQTAYIDYNRYSDLFLIESKGNMDYETIYTLSPSTTYYYISILATNSHIRIAPIEELRTEDLNLYVSLEGSDVIWCGVNFMSNRGEFEPAQLFENDLFSQSGLPNPSEETIEGEWRYPSKEELEQLSKICQVTLVDYKKMFVRLTDAKSNHLYIPFNQYYLKDNVIGIDGYAFPYKGGEGGLVFNTGDIYGTLDEKIAASPYFGNSLNEVNKRPMYIKENFYDWSYSYLGSDEIVSGHEKRGVRFVMDK